LEDFLLIGDKELSSRLFIGTGKFSSKKIIHEVIESSGTDMVTVALRRINFDSDDDNILNYLPKRCQIMPNTSGARNACEAVRLANLARESGCGSWVKIEVIPDTKYLLPDNYETLKATEILSKEGFTVLPYMNPDLILAKSLRDVGASAIMPLGAPIGTNRGLKTKEIIRIMIEEIELPIIIDAGLGKPSDVAEAMEIGAAAVLVNTAIATSPDPVGMAYAFRLAVEAGRKAFLSGMGIVSSKAAASSPLTGFLYEN